MFALAAAPAQAEWFTHIYGPHSAAIQAEGTTEPDPQVQESSGLVASRTSADIFWTHNDSGAAAPAVWAFRLSAADRAAGTARRMGSIVLTGASNVDWEDIADGPGNTIYAFDGGDNPPCDLTNKRIHRFVEPAINPNGSPINLTTTFDSIRFEYPDSTNPLLPADSNAERYDAECLFVHPTTGDMYVVTKRNTSNVGTARVYKLPASAVTWNSATVHVLQFVIDLTAAVGGAGTTVTGGDVDAFGRRVVIRRYPTAYEFTLPAGQPFDTIFQQTPVSLNLAGENQGEAICYDQAGAGGNLITTSEVIASIGPQRLPFYITPWQLANVRAEPVRVNKATIRWDTSAALNSKVDYGTTTSYGQTVTDASTVTSHVITLLNLLPGTTYYYRVTSGSLVHPQPAGAGGVLFTTRSFVSPDFDHDNDVDLSDFAVLQICFSGDGIPQTDPACAAARLDADPDVDAGDFDYFQGCASGPTLPVDPNCEP